MPEEIPDPFYGTRAEHLAWAKRRALMYVDEPNAQWLASLGSDLNKHPATRNHAGVDTAFRMVVSNLFKSREQIIKYIEGFN